MINLAALQLADKLAAIAPVAGTTAQQFTQRYPPSKPLAVLYFHGTDDPFAYFSGGSKGTRRGSSFSAEQFVRYWAENNGCKLTPEKTRMADRVADDTRVIRITYTDCKANADVVFYKIEGGGHTWPGRTDLSGAKMKPLGQVTGDIDANRLMWDFFKTHVRQ